MQKRFLSGTLVLLAALLLFSVLTFAETEITTTGIKSVSAPQAGKTPEYTMTFQYSAMYGADTSFDDGAQTVNGICWVDKSTGVTLKKTDRFIGGRSYEVQILLLAKSGYAFRCDKNWMVKGNVTVNGKDAVGMGGTKNVPSSSDLVRDAMITYEFAPLPLTDVSAVDVTLTAPAVGQTAAFSASVGSAGAEVKTDAAGSFRNGVAWFDETANKYLSAGEKFTAGHVYRVHVSLRPQDGYVFKVSGSEPAVTGKINGKSASVDGTGTGTKEQIILVYAFPALTAAHTHSYGEWKVVSGASCTESGTKERVCSCGQKETATIPANGHEYQTYAAKPSTCVTPGWSEHLICGVCGVEFDSAKKQHPASYFALPLDKNNHEGAEKIERDAQNHWEICKCGVVLEKSAHTFGEWEVLRPATADETGEKQHICTFCGYLATEEIPKVSSDHVHAYTLKFNDEIHWFECSECGDKRDAEPHHFNENNVCTLCSYEKTAQTPTSTGPDGTNTASVTDRPTSPSATDRPTVPSVTDGADESSGLPWVWIILAFVAVGAAGIVLAVLLVKLKKAQR